MMKMNYLCVKIPINPTHCTFKKTNNSNYLFYKGVTFVQEVSWIYVAELFGANGDVCEWI